MHNGGNPCDRGGLNIQQHLGSCTQSFFGRLEGQKAARWIRALTGLRDGKSIEWVVFLEVMIKEPDPATHKTFKTFKTRLLSRAVSFYQCPRLQYYLLSLCLTRSLSSRLSQVRHWEKKNGHTVLKEEKRIIPLWGLAQCRHDGQSASAGSRSQKALLNYKAPR